MHFAIQKAFGWQNSHLHSFHLPKDITKQMMNDRYKGWEELCGLYFRFYYGDEQEVFNDLYWDDDYDESMNSQSWLRRHYNPPYKHYGGVLEHFLICKMYTIDFRNNHPTIKVQRNGCNSEIVEKELDEVTLAQMFNVFFGSYDELLERLTLQQLLTLKRQPDWQKALNKLVDRSLVDFDDHLEKLASLAKERESLKKNKRMSKESRNFLALQNYIDISTLYENTDLEVIPVSNELEYRYDFGDGRYIFA